MHDHPSFPRRSASCRAALVPAPERHCRDGAELFDAVVFRRETHCGDAALVVAGELDVAGEPAFRRELLKLVNSAHSVAWLDLAELRLVDACGLRALLDAHEIGRRSHVELVLRAPSLPVRRLLAVSGMACAFRVDDER